jgi:hypothetical protein
MNDLVDGRESIREHQRVLVGLEDAAWQLFDSGRLEAAAVAAQVAARYAWFNPPGRFASERLEELVARIGTENLSSEAVPRARSVDRVLHVVTQAYSTGGSTQAVASWITQDDGRRHRVCITRQLEVPVPAKLTDALDSSRDLIILDRKRGGLLRRAAALRALAAEADVVLLHLHPFDVVPAIAFARSPGPPVVYVDHTDHVFWLGVRSAELLMSMRISGRDLAVRRRGFPVARSVVMNRPLVLRNRVTARADAKVALGIDPSTIVLATAADPSKYRPARGSGFLDVAVPVVAAHPNVVLLAAGPSADADWQRAAEATGGRIRALGMLPDVVGVHEACDIYLDSFPFSSLTSMLEAGNMGAPAVRYQGHPPGCDVLAGDTPALDGLWATADTPMSYLERVHELIVDEDIRATLGEQTRLAINSSHTGPGWHLAVDDLYKLALTSTRTPAAGGVEFEAGELDVLLDLVMQQTGHGAGLAGAYADNLAVMPLPQRLKVARRLSSQGHKLRAYQMLPERALGPTSALKRQLNDRIRDHRSSPIVAGRG